MRHAVQAERLREASKILPKLLPHGDRRDLDYRQLTP